LSDIKPLFYLVYLATTAIPIFEETFNANKATVGRQTGPGCIRFGVALEHPDHAHARREDRFLPLKHRC
jgi:hypothetical protein